MKLGNGRRGLSIVVFLICVAALSTGVWRYAVHRGMAQLAARGTADLALASDRLVGQLQRYRDLAVIMADHPQVLNVLAQNGAGPSDNDLLQSAADKAAALDVMVVDRSGRVLAAAGNGAGITGAGAFVRRALNGALGRGYGAGSGRSYFYAAPVFAASGETMGALVVSTDLASVDYAWRGDTPPVFFTDGQGRVQVSNRSELVLWQRPDRDDLVQLAQQMDFEESRIAGHEIWRLRGGPYLPQDALHLTQDLPVIGMTGEVLLDVAPVRRLAASQAAAVAALCLAFGALLFLATERRRTLALANAQLEARVKARTQALRDINNELRREAAERSEAQLALAQAQDDLVQASKLSALGQLSAGISHELNQPLMAVQSFAENGVKFIERDKPERAAENLSRISDMADRMGRIIKNLRAFSKQETVQQVQVDLGRVLGSALELTQARRATMAVTLEFEAPQAPIWVQGGEVRLGQVFVNLVTNALDAMQDVQERRLEIKIAQADAVTVTITDTGHGIEAPEQVFDPFYSTKEVGAAKGIGLGLSISYAIVQSVGGEIRVHNTAQGACFTVMLLPMKQDRAA
ncbi:sensor histidine kinase [Sulfitobacter donghicola]|uniref:C4-dicarboxylate transport sensor protein DctB n=1 Tax=Sulfitobacter donghicola DSW-25 = KCTC 12864 = JCM 14565 TaxID=1300350 RepID=A0A073IL84_9RHOB|nr:ATP-binding protein [Sulfitobacter donghicola]KEJ90271.1 C4-dicarboxylate ABC transporter [Sulfitobacter donghicola DSW-25 = KCTC 12864 = JCM 14565]KIN66559.1 C4-dicarboxylate transport sensor protein [Sulfitobacter donghicola DSW-25 = KCTC 12864 = JCM 14565]